MNYKKAFYSKLEDCYLGVKIRDFHKGNIAKSGFSNLLKIKEQYFAHIKAYLESQIESEALSHDIYNKLFTFFDSYLNESGTPFFSDTPIYKNIYAKIYTNSKDTSLFYKTQNLYYVKSDTLYQSLTLSDEKQSYEVAFDASEYKQNADNTKNKIIFKFAGVKTNDEGAAQILIKVSNQKDLFPELNSIFKQNSNEFSEEFLKDLRQKEILKDFKIKINEEELKKIFRSYKKQSEIDFFIHKNATAFLKEQFDLWMFGYLYKESDIQEWNPDIIAHLQRIKNIAYEVIKFIGDFENELKAVWLKPKFAKKVKYVFSIDKLNPNLMDSIINDKGFESQIKEWQELNLIGEDFNKEDLLSNDKYRYLPIDTKHFSKETKYQILSSFENLESILNGELIKADNFQALNTLMPKYQDKVDLIYIDPPFNTGSDFEYKDKFQDSTWLSLMENRLELARELLSDRGSFYLHLDHNANYRGRELLNNIFGEENFRNEIIWAYRSGGASKRESMPRKHDNIWLYAKNDDFYINPLYERQYYEINFMNSCKQDNDGRFYADTLLRDILEGDIKIVQGKLLKEYSVKPVLNLSAEHLGFGTQKPEGLLNLLFDIASSNQDSIILDYHLGSGTTLAVAQKLGRKWLGVEMGEHFYNVVIPRLKKTIAGFQSGISKECDYKGGGAFRYYELESYEEALSHCEYVLDCKEAKKAENKNNYKGKDYAKAKTILDYRKSRKLIDKLNKGESVCLDMRTEYREDFDIFHSMANLMGWKIKRLFLDSKGIESCEFDNGEIISLEAIDLYKYPKLKNLIWWE